LGDPELGTQEVALFVRTDGDEYFRLFVLRELKGGQSDATRSGVDENGLLITRQLSAALPTQRKTLKVAQRGRIFLTWPSWRFPR
jgi:hypothetical protein